MSPNAPAPDPKFEANDFRGLLQYELIQRCKRNPRYSLRAFARTLSTDSSYLSKLLQGKRDASWKVVQRFAPKLGLEPSQVERFRKAPSKKGFSPANGLAPAPYAELSYDAFQWMSDWHHYAILELLAVPNFHPSPRKMAKALGLQVSQVHDALERMQRLGLLKMGPRSRYTLLSANNTTIGSAFTAAALKKMQRQVLQMAIDALDVTPIQERDQSAMTMAIDSRLLPEAKERIRAFRRELCEFLQEGRQRDRVYHLSVSLYPVSQILEKPRRNP